MKVKIELSIEELNKILNALGNQSYVQVFELIENIKKQVASQTENKS